MSSGGDDGDGVESEQADLDCAETDVGMAPSPFRLTDST